jgi:hypothetical protein
MANPAAQMLKNFWQISLRVTVFFISTILNNFSGFISSKVCILFWQFCSFARFIKIQANSKSMRVTSLSTF